MPHMRRIALLCAALLGVLPAAATAAPKARDFELHVGTGAATAHAASGTWTSRAIRPGRRFSVVGARWRSAPATLKGQIRVHDARGWHRWVELPHADGDGTESDPVWAGRAADAVQLRLSRRVHGLRLHFVAVSGEPEHLRPLARAAQSGPPAIIPRSQWGGDTQCVPRDTPSMGTVQMAFIHHTVNANDYGPADSAGMVLAMCRYHRDGNGWDDIGYNFLVDKYGQIFEGRAGGIDQPVVGAQAQGWNAQSTGIANLGTYQDVPQTQQAIDAMARLLAWKLPLHGVPVTGTVTLTSAGGDTNRYPEGAQHTFERISGHGDADATECPGAQLYAQLPALRAEADQLAPDVIPAPQPVTWPAKLTLVANRLALSYPEPAQLSGRLVNADGTPIGGRQVRIQVLTAKGFKAVSSVTTGADGAFSASLPTSRNRSVRALVGNVVSNTVRLKVAPALAANAPAKRVQAGRRAVVKGTLRPRKGVLSVQVAIQRGRSYRRARTVKVTVRNGSFRQPITLTKPALYRLRVRFAGDARNAPAQADFYVRAVRRLNPAGAVQAAR